MEALTESSARGMLLTETKRVPVQSGAVARNGRVKVHSTDPEKTMRSTLDPAEHYVRKPPALLNDSPRLRERSGASKIAPIPAHSTILAAGQKKEIP